MINFTQPPHYMNKNTVNLSIYYLFTTGVRYPTSPSRSLITSLAATDLVGSMIWMLGVYLYPGPELEEVEKDVLKRFSKKMTKDRENRQKMGMMMVRKSSRWPGGVMAGV